MFDGIFSFIKYWYFRYLLVTELYMVEKWERFMIHTVFFVFFSMVSLFNSYVVLRLVAAVTGSCTAGNAWEEVDKNFLANSVI